MNRNQMEPEENPAAKPVFPKGKLLSLDDIPEPFKKYCHTEERPVESKSEDRRDRSKKKEADYRDLLFMMLVFFIFLEQENV